MNSINKTNKKIIFPILVGYLNNKVKIIINNKKLIIK